MDRTSWIAVVACLLMIFGWEYYVQHRYVQPAITRPAPAAAAPNQAPPLTSIPATPTAAPSLTDQAFAASTQVKAANNLPPEQVSVLENDWQRVTFTTNGGAIKSVELLQHHADGTNNVILNQQDEEPMLNMAGWDGELSILPYTRIASTVAENNAVTFRRTLPDGAHIERTYKLGPSYQIYLDQKITNPGAEPLTLPAYRLNVGLSTPIHKHDTVTFIGAGWFTANPAEYHHLVVPDFDAGGLLGFNWREAREVIPTQMTALNWVAVKNQFFTSILIPPGEQLPTHALSERVTLPRLDATGPLLHGVKTHAFFAPLTVPAHATDDATFTLYAGPKQYDQLKLLGHREDEIMEFGWISWVAKPLLVVMNTLHHGLGFSLGSWKLDFSLWNYGAAIIVLTILIKLVFWPLQSAANRSMKKMQALQPKMKELQEKYKEDAPKMQTELMKLYKDYGVNPVGGCLPMLVQIPIFIGFYSMLQSAVELRNASWLWVKDLAQPDTIFIIPYLGLDVNPLPIIMTFSQYFQMKLTPQMGDSTQMKIMQWMPFVMLIFFYNFASALSLYWTVNNLVTMYQTYRNLRKPVPVLVRQKKKTQPSLKK